MLPLSSPPCGHALRSSSARTPDYESAVSATVHGGRAGSAESPAPELHLRTCERSKHKPLRLQLEYCCRALTPAQQSWVSAIPLRALPTQQGSHSSAFTAGETSPKPKACFLMPAPLPCTPGILEKMKEIELELSRTQNNKATNAHIGVLKARLTKLRNELLNPPSGPGGAGEVRGGVCSFVLLASYVSLSRGFCCCTVFCDACCCTSLQAAAAAHPAHMLNTRLTRLSAAHHATMRATANCHRALMWRAAATGAWP
jgi:hypothetical protein